MIRQVGSQAEAAVPRPLDIATRALVALLVLLGVSAVGGGVAMLVAPNGALIGMDVAMLADVPLIDDWFVPGLFLSVVLGTGPLVTAWSIVRRPHPRWATAVERRTGEHVSWLAALGVGTVLEAFIAYEAQVITAPEGRWLQWLMASVGGVIIVLTASRPVRRDLRLTDR